MNFEMSFDDGSELDLRLAELVCKYGLQKYTTFFIPTICHLLNKDIREFYREGFMIGGHSVSHPEDIKILSPQKQLEEILDNKIWLEEIIGDKIDRFAYPKGRHDKITEEAVRLSGFKSGRTTIVLKTEYSDPVIKPTTIHIRERIEYGGRNWLDVARELFHVAQKKDSYFHIWGHSWEIEKFGEWEKVDEFFKFVSKNLK